MNNNYQKIIKIAENCEEMDEKLVKSRPKSNMWNLP